MAKKPTKAERKAHKEAKKALKFAGGFSTVTGKDNETVSKWNGHEIVAPGLDLAQLRVANVCRSADPKGFDHPLDAWSIAEWTNALCGEAGEAANIGKKLLRIRKKLRGNKKGEREEKKLLRMLAKEIADVVVYADLTLASERIDLSKAIRKAYNAKSDELGYDFHL